mgnify:CR=1 FL=1|jgi:hypothetical protein
MIDAKEFLKSSHPFVKFSLGLFIVYLLIMIVKAGYLTGQYLQTLVN